MGVVRGMSEGKKRRRGALYKAEQTGRTSEPSSVTRYGIESVGRHTKHDTTGKQFFNKSETEKCIVRGASKNGDCLLSSLRAITLLRDQGPLGLGGACDHPSNFFERGATSHRRPFLGLQLTHS